MSVEAFRANLHEAQRELEIAQTVVGRCKEQGLIEWGTTPKGYEGWLVKGKQADVAYSTLMRTRADVDHWGTLLNQALRAECPPDRRLPVERDDEAVSP